MAVFRSIVVAGFLVACGDPQTPPPYQPLVIGVATDMTAPDLMDRAQLTVTRDGAIVHEVEWTVSGAGDQAFHFPVSSGASGLDEAGADATVAIELTGYRGATEVVSRRAVLDLVEDRSLFIRLGLTAACVGRQDCTPTQSCVEGVCRAESINSKQLPDFESRLVTELTCESPVTYIDTATGAPMPRSADAASCPIDRCFEGLCYKEAPAEIGTRTIEGEWFTTFVETTGTTNVPKDLSTLAPLAIVRGDTGFTTFTGTGSADGTFRIIGVPHGTYYLKVDTTYYVTSSSTFDLSRIQQGRSDPVVPVQPTSIELNLTELSPWATGDLLQVYAPDADTWWYDVGTGAAIAAGTTALANYSFTTQQANATGGNLLEGDALVIAQLTEKQTSSGLLYRAATRFFEPAQPITQTDGGSTIIDGAFASTESVTTNLDVRTSRWAEAVGLVGTTMTALNPRAERASGATMGIYVQGSPAGPAFGWICTSADLCQIEIPDGPDVALDVSFGTPSASDRWAPFVSTSWVGTVPYQLPGSAATRLLVQVHTARLVSSPITPIEPLVGPVSNPQVGGSDLFQMRTGVGTTPTLSWTAPTIGAASEYVIEVVRLTEGAFPRPIRETTIRTSGTSVVIPPDVLIPGESYVFTITSTTTANVAAPHRGRFPNGSATIASGVIVP